MDGLTINSFFDNDAGFDVCINIPYNSLEVYSKLLM